MAARAGNLMPIERGGEWAALEEEYEDRRAALFEVDALIVAKSLDLHSLHARRNEILSGIHDVRRRRARSELDHYLPPLKLYSIEEAD